MYCKRCGSVMARGSGFCRRCKSVVKPNPASEVNPKYINVIISAAIAMIIFLAGIGGIITGGLIRSVFFVESYEQEINLYVAGEADAPERLGSLIPYIAAVPDEEQIAEEQNTEEQIEEGYIEEDHIAEEQTTEEQTIEEHTTEEQITTEEVTIQIEVPADGFILPLSSTLLLTEDDLAGLTSTELRIARNEIFARYGRRFIDPRLQAHFDAMSWYTPALPLGTEPSLTSIEMANVEFIRSFERR